MEAKVLYEAAADEQQLAVMEGAGGKRTGYRIVKRVLDILCSIAALVVLSPVFLITAIAIKLDDGGPVIHKRYCVGKGNKEYIMYKFRSMRVDADDLIDDFSEEQKERYFKGEKLSDDNRITRVGRVIRATSIDELPQLMSVLKGDMSIVGPRPVIKREAEAYGKYAEKLLGVRSGITGIWQTEGRGEIAFLSKEAMEMQLAYADKMGFLFDCKIIGKTVMAVLKKKGAR